MLIYKKIKASAFHLSLSAIFVTLMIAAVIYFWFPLDYLEITNFKEIALLIISIDVVLGPLLTFVVFNPHKKNLYVDLAVIALIQVSALAYGVNALYKIHPLFITYNHGAFNLVHANDVDPKKAKYNQFQISKLSSPTFAFAKMPDDPDLQIKIMTAVDFKGEPDIEKRPEYYEPYDEHMDTILKDSLDASKLFDEAHLTSSSKKFMDKHIGELDDYAYLPLIGISGDAIIVLDKITTQVVATINESPWKFKHSKK